MKIRKLTAFVLAVLLVVSLAACDGSYKTISQEKAQKIALKEAGYSASQVEDIHVHITEVDGVPCYNVHITTDEGDLSYNIDAVTGEILSSGEGGH